MNTEVRFLLAIGLMLVVLVGTNLLFPPVVPEAPVEEEAPGQVDTTGGVPVVPGTLPGAATPTEAGAEETAETAVVAPVVEEAVTVEGPLYRYTFSNVGARLIGAEMVRFRSLNREGVVDLVPEGVSGYLGQRLLIANDTVDLRRTPFEVHPAGGVILSEGEGPRTLRFRYSHPGSSFVMELEYEFQPDGYAVGVRGRVSGVERPRLLTDLGEGLAFAEADSVGEARTMAYVGNHVRDGIKSTILERGQPGVVEGPLRWAAFRSKFFVMALIAGESDPPGEQDYLGGLLLGRAELDQRVRMGVTQAVRPDGSFGYRLFLGPQEYARLASLGQDMEEVNPYGWRFFRPIVRPFVAAITWVLVFFHTQLDLGYGWVLIIFGVLMRVVLWPLNQKAMRAQLKNMAAQPLIQEIQTKYKDNPEKQQKEMMRLYKEEGFNPLAGCLPMLLPWPVLIALFFVFQNTIELRGVAFLWLPDLSAKDPLFILPVFLGVSMFLMQWVSLKAVDQVNPQMKMMLWIMPPMMVFIFFQLASGLNLYYAVSNIATIPQQIWINNERKKMKAKTPAPPARKG